MMLQGCRKADRAEVVERDCFATPNSLKSQGERNYFPRLVILVPKRQSCACLRGQYTLRKITRHSNQVPRLNLRSARGTAGAPLPAISCLGAFWTPAATARGRVRHAGVQKPAQIRTSRLRASQQNDVLEFWCFIRATRRRPGSFRAVFRARAPWPF